jgi:nicotinamidase-related amidase
MPTKKDAAKAAKPAKKERIWDKYLTDRDKAVFEQAGYGAMAAWGKRPALLVIDVNYAFTGESSLPILDSIKKWRNSCGSDGWDAIPVLQKLIEMCRSKGIPVIYTTGTRRPDAWNAGSWAWKNSRNDEDLSVKIEKTSFDGLDGNIIVKEIEPGPRDLVVRKEKPSAFFGSPLQSYLQNLGCDSVIVTGTTTSGCVRATVLDSFSLNFRTTVVEDGCFDRSQASHAINLCDMNAKYANVLSSEEVLEHLRSVPQGMYDLPSGQGVKKGDVWY